jgi:hypothetical protein
MTKLDLQKELLEKVKPGMKPSDLKKKKPKRPSPLAEKDQGYESDNSIKIPKAPPLPKPSSAIGEPKQVKALKRDVEY